MKRILPEFTPTAEQLNTIRRLADECNLTEDTVKILYGRGVDDKVKIEEFLNPSREHFISPFKMTGMREACELIKQARDDGWAVLVYGDYDADGVCASTIMCAVLRDYGVEAVPYVPERKDGYGLSVAAIDEIFEEYFPQLVITVDCGISCKKEVDYIKEQGAEVIVTDHHELPLELPDCICINPKINDGYIYDNLCGAGVAFKVGCALLGEEAYKYLDFAAIATVADSVPLTGENRDIVYEGLKLINATPRKCYSYFLSRQEDKVTSQSLAFSVAPKINAAGRMGDAASALALFHETEENAIFTLASKLSEYNSERQKYCDELYISAKNKINDGDAEDRVIMLYDEDWNSGFVGIVAARLADEYARPTILFVKNGDTLKGSARSVESVNIFEALRACSQYISEFGGHAQAAGVNVFEEDFEGLKAALNAYIAANYRAEDLTPTLYVAGKLQAAYSPRFARELELLEPYGVGNKRPLFVTEEREVAVRPVKPQSPHLSLKGKNLEMMFFSGARFCDLLECAAPKQIVFEYNVSHFRGKEYVKGFVRDIVYGADAGMYARERIAANALQTLVADGINCNIRDISAAEAQRAIDGAGDYGTLFIASSYQTLEKFDCQRLGVELFSLSQKNLSSCILLSPRADCELAGYKTVIYLDDFPVKIPALAGKTVSVCREIPPCEGLYSLSTEREELLKIFSYIAANFRNLEGGTAEEVAFKNPVGDSLQTLFALEVFTQLGLVSFEGGKLTVYRGVKTELTNSPLYNAICALKGNI